MVARDPSETRPMSESDRLDLLRDQWEAARAEGRDLSAEELCRDHPELRQQLDADISTRFNPASPRSGKAVMSETGDSEILSVNSEITGLTFHAKGGLGAVYRATELKVNREVAVKFIHENLAGNPECRQRFTLEAEVTGRLEHPGVVPLYGIGRTDNDRLFYYMRYIDGETLDDAIRRFHETYSEGRSLPVHSVGFRQLLTAFNSVCRTIAYAHNRGIVHRDIKPANVMLGKYGETIVVDWGLAVPVERDHRFRSSGEVSLMPSSGSGTGTDSGGGGGTPAYMSPEQMSGLAPTPASDIYSLGATLYKILTSQPAFTGTEFGRVREQVLNGEFPYPRDYCPGVPQELEAICLRAMAAQPAQRYLTALELVDDIDHYLADAPVSAFQESVFRKLSRWSRQHKAAMRAMVMAAVAILLISFVSAVRMNQLASREQEARKLAVQHGATAEQAREQNLTLSAGFLARAIGYEIDLRWRLLDTETRSAALREMMIAINADPDNEELRRPLQSWLNDRRVLKEDAVANSGWSLFDAVGTQVARAPRRDSLGRSYRHRDYFHGLGRDLSPDDPTLDTLTPFQYALQRTDDQEAVYMSCVFESTNTRTLNVAFSAAIWDRPEEDSRRTPIGVFSIPLEISRFDLPANAMLFQLEDDPFEERPGLVIAHSSLGDRSRKKLPPRVSDDVIEVARMLRAERLRALRGGTAVSATVPSYLPNFRDPVTNRVSPAAIEPIIVLGRPQQVGDTGWFVVVRELHTEKLLTPPGDQ